MVQVGSRPPTFLLPPSIIPTWRRGRVYGTTLVDLEQHRVLELLPSIETEVIAAWLRKQSAIQVVARDRSGIYAEACWQGAPQAQAVADRWHVVNNLYEALVICFTHHHKLLSQIHLPLPLRTMPTTPFCTDSISSPKPLSPEQQLRQDRRAHWETLLAQVQELRQAGLSVNAIGLAFASCRSLT